MSVRELAKRLFARPGLAPRLLVAAACAAILALYWTNDDNAGDATKPRGNGEYLPILDRGDGHMLYLMARSTALDLDWKFDNDLRRFGDPWGQTVGPSGRKQIPHPIGPALIWTPLIWIAEAGAAVANLFGADIPLHGYTRWHQRFVFLSSALAGCAAVLLGRALARRALPGSTWATAYATIAVLLGTPIAFYATYMPSYGHALDALACAAFLAMWACTLGRSDARRWITLGALLGVAMLVRTQDGALGVAIVVEAAAAIVGDLRDKRVDWRVRAVGWLLGGALALAVALVVFFPQLYYWKLVYGAWFGLPQGARYTRFDSPMILELLFSARNGWLSSTPIAYLGVIGLACLPKRARLVAAGLGAALVVQVYLNATILDWWGMNSFGQRRLCSMTLPIVVGLAALLWRCSRLVVRRVPRVPRAVWHALALAVIAPMIAWNLWRLSELGGGKAPTNDLEPTCCDHVPRLVRPLARAIYDVVGDPFELPASAWFAWRHDVEIQRWDQAVGYYALVPPPQSLVDDTMWNERGGWRIGFPKAEPYLVGGWSNAYAADRSFRWTLTPRARVIVPNLMPYAQRYVLWLAPGGTRDVIVRWDGDIVARGTLALGWNRVEFTREHMAVGEHELEIDATPAPPPPAHDDWPTTTQPVGVAVGLLEVTFAEAQ